jgi:hypothetical protein
VRGIADGAGRGDYAARCTDDTRHSAALGSARDASVADASVADAPFADAPVADAPGADAPGADASTLTCADTRADAGTNAAVEDDPPRDSDVIALVSRCDAHTA